MPFWKPYLVRLGDVKIEQTDVSELKKISTPEPEPTPEPNTRT